MNTEEFTRQVRIQLARLTNTNAEDWFLVVRARYGLEVVLRVLADVHGRGEVLTQPFTCTTAINPILTAGHIPDFTDTSYGDLSLDTTKLQASSASRGLIMQHSFGIESDMKKARSFANKHHLLLIEDSAHKLGLMSIKDGAPLADVSLHSFGVEKMLPTKLGGAVWINPNMKDGPLREALVAALGSLPLATKAARRRARHYGFFNRAINHTPHQLAPTIRRLLMAGGLFEPAISADELLGKNHGSPARPDNRTLATIIAALKQYPSNLDNRQAVVKLYAANLPKVLEIPRKLDASEALVRFPVLCRNKAEATMIFDTLRLRGHYSGKWYRPTLFPGTHRPELYNYDFELYPVAEDISSRIVNLPTHISTTEAKEIIDVLHSQVN